MTSEMEELRSCVTRERNTATFLQPGATDNATTPQPTGIKALAARVLARNKQRNRSATATATERNFSPKKESQKLRCCGGQKQEVATISEALKIPSWCNRQCPHFHATIGDVQLVERCHWQDETGRHWVRLRIEQLRRCPMKMKSKIKS